MKTRGGENQKRGLGVTLCPEDGDQEVGEGYKRYTDEVDFGVKVCQFKDVASVSKHDQHPSAEQKTQDHCDDSGYNSDNNRGVDRF